LLRWDLDAPQELNGPQVHDEVRAAVDDSRDDVENVSVDAVLGLDRHVPVGSSWAALENGNQNGADRIAREGDNHCPAEDNVAF